MSAPKILVFAGSWREGSLNTKLATLAARKLRAAGAEVRQISLGDYPLPLVDATGFGNAPQAAHDLRALIDAHDGLYIASPEYNAGYAPALKNALDWASTAKPGAPASGLAGKVVALGGASPGALGAYRGLTQLRTSLELGFGALLVPEMVAVGLADKAFDGDGELTDARSSGFLDAQVARLVKLAGKGV
ncbi:NADPH-dependent oxidoreductase [Bosea caraganae]|uniref:NADPH-dependent oxidoreductase n=1 Tax=Bosea caraganae TaxID=2763117 RepID=A0A370L990_9HYPH|nr:NADPH-dependent FMN reductase [Bosea caraganae]RDJ26837.1 NADPH-dependent oxidoreductase [Bosea caraganae]RDJ30723.1 NADPH-dependent oxidoreductase [Bosea caraganae]